REERLIDTPQSVSVLSSNDIAKLGATKFSDFANTVPGLSFQTSGAGFTDITLRGVTAGFDISPTVGLYVDEVPYGSSTTFGFGAQVALDVGLFDLDRVEILRGPQGTLYGASTMGGLIDLLFIPTDALTVRLTGFLQDISRDGEPTADYTFAGAKPYGRLDQNRRLTENFTERFELVSGTGTYDFGPVTLTSISSYQ